MNIGRRIQLHGPGLAAGRKASSGHSSDEYGNCSVYLFTRLGGIVVFWEPPSHFQTETELPDPGESAWIDRRYFT